MKKLTLAVLISGAMSTAAMAHDHMDKEDHMKQVKHTFTKIDADKDGMLGKDEVSDHVISKHFDKLDTNGDKKLSENEYITYLENNPKAFSEDVKDQVQYTKAKVTADADEVVASSPKDLKTDETQVGADMGSDYSSDSDMNAMNDEMDSMKHESESAMSSYERDENMDDYDSDHDADLRNNDEMAGNEGDRMVAENEFKMMDKNGDGMISEEEASMAGVNSIFDEMDEDKDSMISRQEYREYRRSAEVSR
ncbi:hypothetical protein HHX48_18080 [Salinimonas sp. HHU 13199]|uniref:EF-hand domain-containing protein n=1 Tax=Salinimonas profundi TaxID=2729140 RepID=A0ABR8LN86_9ALTE|nr:hypothetical protein [Salinimonas profundi]MBD3587650.1 hypothetical protein [Salinimonas profundi]